MATVPNLNEYLAELGFDPTVTYSVPRNPSDAALAGINAFMRERLPCRSVESMGIIHVTGPAVKDHTAPLKAIGGLLTALQDGVDAIGASLMGIYTLAGALPLNVTGRTQLSMVASPMPGSVVIQVAPALSRVSDLYPDGREASLFDVEEEIDARPLADLAFDEFSSLIKGLDAEVSSEDDFVGRLTELGPRAASAMRAFCDSVDKGGLDVEFEWREPGHVPESSRLSHLEAKNAAAVIQNAEISSESVELIGVILTITMSAKDKLRIRTDEGAEITLAIGTISPADVIDVHTGDRVRITAERRTSSKAGGRQHERLIGISLEKLRAFDED
ncbi:hypothetical protein GKZ27_06360 [Enterorhabdus mucosicola]|uniref:Uncharacterized protein n=1 Tax=Adlercreutzia mucosicola TaxID=580026 RepID=A0A6N8JMB2_9ACTN|nr:hypothetical protein [Adlercreutzia mucosicola]MVX61073.1 hypothetical protein [Adlercreutzia mucosicola]